MGKGSTMFTLLRASAVLSIGVLMVLPADAGHSGMELLEYCKLADVLGSPASEIHPSSVDGAQAGTCLGYMSAFDESIIFWGAQEKKMSQMA
jgi:hypothetical protein